MKKIQVLGPGCTKCTATAKQITETASALGVEIAIEKVDDVAKIAAAGVMATPAVIIEGKLVHSGGVPPKERIEQWLLS
jgi:small redox-active disulfide protein 2